jgi:hypothetical protein
MTRQSAQISNTSPCLSGNPTTPSGFPPDQIGRVMGQAHSEMVLTRFRPQWPVLKIAVAYFDLDRKCHSIAAGIASNCT